MRVQKQCQTGVSYTSTGPVGVYISNNSVVVFTTWGSGQALKLDEPFYFCGVDLCGDLA